jgi:ribonuclease-3
MRWARRLLDRVGGTLRVRTADQPDEPDDGRLLRDVRGFQRALGYRIRNRTLFVQALLHRSFHQHATGASLSNERLEFLGDSILNLIVGEYLYRTLPLAHEGELTKIRSRLVNRRALAAYAQTLRLSAHILMSPSTAQSVGKGLETIMADTFEAVVAALYLDGGYNAARRFVEREVINAIRRGTVVTADDNYKSILLEYAQAKGLGVPRYSVIRQEGPDHDRTFTVEVFLRNERKGFGQGKNKKEAEQAAAGDALQSLL